MSSFRKAGSGFGRHGYFNSWVLGLKNEDKNFFINPSKSLGTQLQQTLGAHPKPLESHIIYNIDVI